MNLIFNFITAILKRVAVLIKDIDMTEIIDFNKHIFPLGTVAFHPKYRSCKIVKIEGTNRKIRYGEIEEGKLNFKYAIVPFSELQDHKIINEIGSN